MYNAACETTRSRCGKRGGYQFPSYLNEVYCDEALPHMAVHGVQDYEMGRTPWAKRTGTTVAKHEDIGSGVDTGIFPCQLEQCYVAEQGERRVRTSSIVEAPDAVAAACRHY